MDKLDVIVSVSLNYWTTTGKRFIISGKGIKLAKSNLEPPFNTNNTPASPPTTGYGPCYGPSWSNFNSTKTEVMTLTIDIT